MLSIPHLILIFLVALIVFGPEKLPELARTLSKAMIEFRRTTGGLRETLEQEMRDLEREVAERRPTEPRQPAALPAASEPAEVATDQPQAAETASEGAESKPQEDGTPSSDTPPEKPANGHPTAA